MSILTEGLSRLRSYYHSAIEAPGNARQDGSRSACDQVCPTAPPSASPIQPNEITKPYVTLASLLEAADRPAEALAWLGQEPTAEDIPGLLLNARLLIKCGLKPGAAEKAPELINTVLKNENNLSLDEIIEARSLLLQIFLSRSEYDQARDEYDTLQQLSAELDPEAASILRFQLAYLSGDLDGALAAFREIPPPLNEFDYERHELHKQLDELLDPRPPYERLALPEREAYLNQRLAEIESSDATVYDLLEGIALCFQLNDLDTAGGLLRRAEELDPYSREVVMAKLELLRGQGDYDEALTLIDTLPAGSGLRSIKQSILTEKSISNGLSKKERKELYGQSEALKYAMANELFDRVAAFPESQSAWLNLARFYQSFYQDTYHDALSFFGVAGNLTPPEATAALRQIREEYFNLTLFAPGGSVTLDGLPVRMRPLHPAELDTLGRQGLFKDKILKSGPELENLLSRKTSNYFVARPEQLAVEIAKRFPGVDLSSLSLSAAISLAAKLTENEIKYDVTGTGAADPASKPIEQKLADGDFHTGVCRNYADLIAAVFDAIKAVNPQLANAYIAINWGHEHAWNTILVLRSDRIDAFVIDTTAADNGGPLDGRFNFQYYN